MAAAAILKTLHSTRGLAGGIFKRAIQTTAALPATQQSALEHPEGRIKCTLIPGDGVGPELVHSVQQIFEAANVPLDFEQYFISEVQPTLSVPLETVVDSVARNGIALKGVLSTPYTNVAGELQSLNMLFRRSLDLFANVVHIRSVPSLKTRHHDLDFIIIREQTEGEYSAIEHESVAGVIECMKVVTREKSYRVAKFAFDYATRWGRKKVTCVHKANIMKLGDGLFLQVCEEVAQLYPRIEFNNMIVDNCTMQLVSKPHQFDVLVMGNLYGSIVDNIAVGLVGGAGVVAGESYSSDCVVFEPGARHTYSEAVGKSVANPTAMIRCGNHMLRHVNLHNYADMIRKALMKVLQGGKVRTKDMGGYASTDDFTRAVISNLH